MENEKETRIASKLADYVDGKDIVSGDGWEDTAADIETVNLLRLGFGEEEAADEVFSRRLRRELVEESERRGAPRRWGAAGWALVAASICLLLVSGLLIQRGVTERKTASGGAGEMTTAMSPAPEAPKTQEEPAPAPGDEREMMSAGSPAIEELEKPEETALMPVAPVSEDETTGYRTAAFSGGAPEEFRMEPFSGASEVRIERVTVRWRESRMNAVYERYTIERGGE